MCGRLGAQATGAHYPGSTIREVPDRDQAVVTERDLVPALDPRWQLDRTAIRDQLVRAAKRDVVLALRSHRPVALVLCAGRRRDALPIASDLEHTIAAADHQ